MYSSRMRPSILAATTLTALLLAGIGQARAGVEMAGSAGDYDNLAAVERTSSGRLTESNISVGDVKEMQKHINRLNQLTSDQADTISALRRQVDDLKRDSGSASELSGIQRRLEAQERKTDQLQRSLDDLARKVK
ncbi:hypothetical protein [Pseudomonas tohonis]|uniref:hypothetical protein n=1 Tax=Pseudomonas tohonis TaxID=2725477 RepID=UPI0021DB6042|nr:hypothetical protein [Pseudomonas tohonis]UXY53930.1 hypothetical protein N9L84_04885 [Pseudomonas tohonis]